MSENGGELYTVKLQYNKPHYQANSDITRLSQKSLKTIIAINSVTRSFHAIVTSLCSCNKERPLIKLFPPCHFATFSGLFTMYILRQDTAQEFDVFNYLIFISFAILYFCIALIASFEQLHVFLLKTVLHK